MAIMCLYHKIDTFVVSKDEWNIKEDTVKSMKNALYVQQYGKSHLSGWKKIKPVDLAIVEFKQSVRYLINQLVEKL